MTTATTSSTIPGPGPRAGVVNSEIDPYHDAFLDNPYAYHDELRTAPAVWLSKYGVWAVARFDEGQAVAKDYKTFCSAAGVGVSNLKIEKNWRPPSLLIEADPPEHTRARNVIARAMSQRAIAALQERFERDADAAIDRALQKDLVDGMADLAIAFPLKAFPDAVGLDPNERENLLTYGNMIFNVMGPRNRLQLESFDKGAALTPWITARCQKENLALGSIGAHIYDGVDAGEVTANEAALLVRSLLSAGVDTTISALGNALHAFSTHPDQWALLHAEPAQAKHAFEEAIRFESPVQHWFRTSTVATDLSGVPIGPDEKVLVLFGACNRDPRRWKDPDTFDIKRRPDGHLAWGNGIHRCVGQRVAQMEGEILLKKLAERVKRIEPAGAPKRRLNNSIRVLESLPLRLIPA